MSFSDRDRNAARAIVHIFETGKAHGNPSAVAVLPDGAGLSVGTSQATHKSGSLLKVIKEYAAAGGLLTDDLLAYETLLSRSDVESITTASRDVTLKRLLIKAGTEPIMRRAQETVFDVNYMVPAIRACEGSGFTLPLSLAVVYDSHIQGSFGRIRDMVTAGLEEKKWIRAYCTTRRAWMLRKGGIVAKTIYRPDAFLRMMDIENWQLLTPFVVRGVMITDSDVG